MLHVPRLQNVMLQTPVFVSAAADCHVLIKIPGFDISSAQS